MSSARLPTIGTCEEEVRGDEDQRHLHAADHHIGGDLAEHDLDRADRHGEQALHRAALDLARDRERREDQHGQRQDRAHEAGHDVEPRLAGRIVAAVHAQLVGLRGLRRERPPGRRGRGRRRCATRPCRAETAPPVADRVGGVGDDEQRGALAAHQVAAEIGRDLHAELHGAGEQELVELLLARGAPHDVKIVARPHGRQERAREGAVVLDEHGGRQMLGVGVDGVAEQQELEQRDEDHRRESDAVAAKLDQLLDEGRVDAPQRGARGARQRAGCAIVIRRSLRNCPSARLIRSMNTSSSVGSPGVQVWGPRVPQVSRAPHRGWRPRGRSHAARCRTAPPCRRQRSASASRPVRRARHR